MSDLTSYVQDLLLAAKCNLVKKDPDFTRTQIHLQSCDKLLTQMVNLISQNRAKQGSAKITNEGPFQGPPNRNQKNAVFIPNFAEFRWVLQAYSVMAALYHACGNEV